jgi:glutamate-1-semialdehyde 2,1-aminomutase
VWKVPTIDEMFVKSRPKSQALYAEAVQTFPAGVTHDTRYLTPFPIFVTHAKGPRKWDVDGHEYIDYVGGHGALLLGHSHPVVVEAVQEQMAKGTHFGASHELELEWGRLVKQLVPSAERVRFVSSGTEASLMAVRLVRGYTGKKKIVKFQGHFHGWHDQVMPAVNAPFDEPSSIGLLPATLETTIVLPVNDIAAVERTLAEDDDIAAVILEAAGASTGAIPIMPGFHADLRAVTKAHNTVLIFDEVVTGFRYSPGGVQALTGVMPDMTILAKILAGGLPGGAVVGRADILEQLDFKTKRRVYHPGTFNANPLSAAAGIAALKLVATGEPNRKADAAAAQLMRRWNEAIEERQAEACVYGEASFLHVYMGPQEKPGKRGGRDAWTDDPNKLKGMGRAVTGGFRRAMMLSGLDFIGASAIVSATHGEREIEESAAAFAKGLDLLIADGIVKVKS